MTTREIAESIRRGLGLPVSSIEPDDAVAHFGRSGTFFAMDMAATSRAAQDRFDWHPTGPTLLEDLADGAYFVR